MTSQLPLEAFPTWALLNDISVPAIQLRHIQGKGSGFVLSQDLAQDQEEQEFLLKVPRDLVLSSEAIDGYAKVDANFKQLIEAVGHKSTRLDAMMYLLCHLVHCRKGPSASRGTTSTPWTEYLRFLPQSIPVPTLWTKPERLLLSGTSLQSALEAKLSALAIEFDQVRTATEKMPFWNELLWEHDSISLDDWSLIDAWYRSRCLELPQFGDAMVPGLDMVNHAHLPTTYYEVAGNGDVLLLSHPDCAASRGQEVTISYGQAKSAAEMLFSYGFVDCESTCRSIKLPLDPLPDDPLAKAKVHVFDRPRTVALTLDNQTVRWECPFAYLACLNEEDGLEFRLLQDMDGDRYLRLFWQENDITDQIGDFEELIQDHPLCEVFKLRAVMILHDLVHSQLAQIKGGPSDDQLQPLVASGLLRNECIASARALRESETIILESAAHALDKEVGGPSLRNKTSPKALDLVARTIGSARQVRRACSIMVQSQCLSNADECDFLQKETLLTHDHVVAYLGSMEDVRDDEAPEDPTPNEDDDDFS
ncbi:hypothetical protein HIM_01142 [Hirsutella minnesotensis 3608]|nr:hypothetical protein HIM_01142 [Hirsutella minnesotensis 3608]